jgi:hypothetical protein
VTNESAWAGYPQDDMHPIRDRSALFAEYAVADDEARDGAVIRLEREIVKLREVAAFKSTELLKRDRVIARLLDGWQADVSVSEWWKAYGDVVGRIEPMSDGEAAIIRNHQEKRT